MSLSVSPLTILGSVRWNFQPLHFKELHNFFYFLTLKEMFLQSLHKYLWKNNMSIMSIFRVFLNETSFLIINEICLCIVLVLWKRNNNNNNNFKKTHTPLTSLWKLSLQVIREKNYLNIRPFCWNRASDNFLSLDFVCSLLKLAKMPFSPGSAVCWPM